MTHKSFWLITIFIVFASIPSYAQTQVNGAPAIVELAQIEEGETVPNLLEPQSSEGTIVTEIPVENVEPPAKTGAVTVRPPANSVPNIPSTPTGANQAADVPTVFYDANDIVPESFQTQSSGPAGQVRPVEEANPNETPASKFISVKKDSEKGSQKSRLVAANRAVKLGRYESALKLYDDLYDKNPRDIRVLMGRATVQQKLGQIDAAIMSYQQVIDLDESNLSAQINMLGLMTDLYPSVALRRLMMLSQDYPEHPGIVSQIALAHARLASFDEALKFFGMAAAIEPNNPTHYYNLAIVSDKQSDFSKAIEYYEKALEIDAVYGNSRSVPREQIFERLAQLR